MDATAKPLVRRTIVSVLCMCERETSILLVHQEGPDGQSGWALPGGTWEIDESAEEAARREVKEETGLDVEIVRLYDSRVEVYEDEDTRVAVFILTYEARCTGGEIQPQDPDLQVHHAAWVPVAILHHLPFIHSTQRDLIQRYVAERQSRAFSPS